MFELKRKLTKLTLPTKTGYSYNYIGLFLFYEYHDLCYKIYRIGSFSYKTVFSCLVELPGNIKPQGHKSRKEE